MIYINELPPFWADTLGVDLETTSLDPFTGKILSIALSDGQDVWLFLHWFKFDCLKSVLEDEKVIKIYHNAKFDLQFIKHHLGFEVRNIYDTMLAEQVLIAARDMNASLADVMARRIGSYMEKSVRTTFYDHPGFHIKPITQDQIEYMAGDVLYLPKIMELQLLEAQETKCVWTIDIENKAVPAFVDIELGGFKLDVERWYQYLEVFNQKIDESKTKLRTLLGDDFVLRFMNKSKIKPVEKVYTVDKINFGSSDQLKPLFKLKYGLEIKTADRKYLEELSDSLDDDHAAREFIDELLTCKHWQKLVTWNYPKYVHPVTGKVHPSTHQIGTDTGRTSYSDPNLQQSPRPVPNEPNMRQLWTADDEDLVLLALDFGQQEVRVLASASKDQALIAACNKEDVYIETGSMMYDKRIVKSDPERQLAKIFVLAVGFRSGVGRLRRASRLPSKQCEKVRQIIWDKFPTMKKYGAACEGFAKRNGYIMTLTGRRRYFTARNQIYTEAVNTVVQGTSADQFKIALGNIYKHLTELKACGNIDHRTRVWHVMHDEAVLQCRKDEVQQIQKIAEDYMASAGRELCSDVLHVTEAHYEYRWNK